MKFNKKQISLLININRQDGNKSISELGKGVYNTYRMTHINLNKFLDIGIVEYDTKKNKVIPKLTEYGRSLLRSLL